jgi:hypothetical protein
MNGEYESIARMIEAEASAWPEDVERLASLAARVRNRAPGGKAPVAGRNDPVDREKLRP